MEGSQDLNTQVKYGPEMENIYPFLSTLSEGKRVLFITTSNRGEYISSKGEKPKSTRLAEHFKELLEEKKRLKKDEWRARGRHEEVKKQR